MDLDHLNHSQGAFCNVVKIPVRVWLPVCGSYLSVEASNSRDSGHTKLHLELELNCVYIII